VGSREGSVGSQRSPRWVLAKSRLSPGEDPSKSTVILGQVLGRFWSSPSGFPAGFGWVSVKS
jgi:hypothetical protein